MIVPVERIWEKFENRYEAVNVAALEARRLKDGQADGLKEQKIDPISTALKKLVSGKIRYKE